MTCCRKALNVIADLLKKLIELFFSVFSINKLAASAYLNLEGTSSVMVEFDLTLFTKKISGKLYAEFEMNNILKAILPILMSAFTSIFNAAKSRRDDVEAAIS